MGIIDTTCNKENKWSKDYFMPKQDHPVDYKKDVIEQNGQNMKDKLLKGFPQDQIMADVYTRHPSMRDEISRKGMGAENIEKTEDTSIA
jgi:hypothetical protein